MARVPVIHHGAAEQMTANVLKRMDPDVEELLASAGHVALYDFDIPTKRWSRKDVEGSLFLVRRLSQPHFQLVILNKKSAVATETFVENVHCGFQCEVVGMWFYDEADCNRIAALLHNIAATLPGFQDVTGEGQAAGKLGHSQALEVGIYNPSPPCSASHSTSGDQFAGAPAPLGSHKGSHIQQQQGAICQQDQVVAGSSNLARLFAGMKLQHAGNTAHQLHNRAPESAPQLLTPQLIEQEQAGAQDTRASKGDILLQNLPWSVLEEEQTLPARVACMLSALASNEDFCEIVANELKKIGLA